jgi:EEF1A N-terminal glycine/lysine methyltransferase
MSYPRKPSIPPPTVAGTPQKFLKSRWSDQSVGQKGDVDKRKRSVSQKTASNLSIRSLGSKTNVDAKKEQSATAPIVNISHSQNNSVDDAEGGLAEELDYITVSSPNAPSTPNSNTTALSQVARADKASRLLGISHRRSMEPIPASRRASIVSTRSARDAPPTPGFVPTLPLTSLYVVSGLPKSPHTWTLADPDSVLGLHHSDSAVNRWWRPEVLGSTVSPGAGGGQKKRRQNGKHDEIMKGAGALSKQEVGKMLSKALKVCFTCWYQANHG